MSLLLFFLLTVLDVHFYLLVSQMLRLRIDNKCFAHVFNAAALTFNDHLLQACEMVNVFRVLLFSASNLFGEFVGIISIVSVSVWSLYLRRLSFST